MWFTGSVAQCYGWPYCGAFYPWICSIICHIFSSLSVPYDLIAATTRKTFITKPNHQPVWEDRSEEITLMIYRSSTFYAASIYNVLCIRRIYSHTAFSIYDGSCSLYDHSSKRVLVHHIRLLLLSGEMMTMSLKCSGDNKIQSSCSHPPIWFTASLLL